MILPDPVGAYPRLTENEFTNAFCLRIGGNIFFSLPRVGQFMIEADLSFIAGYWDADFVIFYALVSRWLSGLICLTSATAQWDFLSLPTARPLYILINFKV